MRPLSGAAAADNANSWKYAAAEIHQILAKARDAGTANLQVMEQKLAEMVMNMTDQSKLVSKLEAELQKKEEVAMTIMLRIICNACIHVIDCFWK